MKNLSCDNCFTIQSPSFFFDKYLWEAAIFSQERSKEGEKRVSFTHDQIIICSQTQSQTRLDHIAHEQSIICRQLFAGHVVGSRPMKRKKTLRGMIMSFICMRMNIICISMASRLVSLGKRGWSNLEMGYKTAVMLVFKSGEVCDIR